MKTITFKIMQIMPLILIGCVVGLILATSLINYEYSYQPPRLISQTLPVALQVKAFNQNQAGTRVVSLQPTVQTPYLQPTIEGNQLQ